MTGPLAIGVGCRRDCPAAAIADLVRDALARAGGGPARLYTVADKAGEAGLAAAARDLGLDLVMLPRAALEAVMHQVLTPSAASASALGLASVSEASALAGAGPGARLVVRRIAAGGATCAVARGEGSA